MGICIIMCSVEVTVGEILNQWSKVCRLVFSYDGKECFVEHHSQLFSCEKGDTLRIRVVEFDCENYKENTIHGADYVMNGQVAQMRGDDRMCIVSCGGLLLKLPQSCVDIDTKKTLQVALSRTTYQDCAS